MVKAVLCLASKEAETKLAESNEAMKVGRTKERNHWRSMKKGNLKDVMEKEGLVR